MRYWNLLSIVLNSAVAGVSLYKHSPWAALNIAACALSIYLHVKEEMT